MNIAGNFKPFCRSFHLSRYSGANIHRAFRKVLASNSSKRRPLKFQDFPVIEKVGNFKHNEEKTRIKPVFRRVNVLNKLFMRYITDLIVNGEHWNKYTSLGIEITKIEISPDYKKLNIFWTSKNSENEKEIIKFLTDNAFTLRHELSQLKIVGIVPPLSFVKDKHHTQVMELDKRMAQADYGEEYEPLSVSRLKHKFELYCPLEEDVKIQLEKLEVENEEEAVDEELPMMPQNVLGLDHSDIMKKIMNHKKPQTRHNLSGDTSTRKCSENLEDVSTSRDEFKLFLHKRQISNQKMKKGNKQDTIDMDLIKEDLSRSFEEHYDNIGGHLDEFEDYIDDDETEEK